MYFYYINCINSIIDSMVSSLKVSSLNPISATYQSQKFSEPLPFSVKWEKLYTYLQGCYGK